MDREPVVDAETVASTDTQCMDIVRVYDNCNDKIITSSLVVIVTQQDKLQ